MSDARPGEAAAYAAAVARHPRDWHHFVYFGGQRWGWLVYSSPPEVKP